MIKKVSTTKSMKRAISAVLNKWPGKERFGIYRSSIRIYNDQMGISRNKTFKRRRAEEIVARELEGNF
ncbi:UNVERIFIED_CONTAM: hypothetical protein NCL1_51353 [Trichonephila clavipes]